MEELKRQLDELNRDILALENRIDEAKNEAEANIVPLEMELERVRNEKRNFGLKNDFETVQSLRRRENNLKFKIDSQWNLHSILIEDFSKLKRKRHDLESQIKLEEDKIKRSNEIRAKMDIVIANYRKTQNLRQAAIDSKISPENVRQWYDWGANDFDEIYSYFYGQIKEIDDYFRVLETEKLKRQMDDVVEAYMKTNSLKKAAEIAHVSYDTVQYWYEWGSRGFGAENSYFYNRIKLIE
ncbi:hypothetical protein [Methanobrevibacter sp.]|uniref:hypothetical protein n=1 Tax=Methanobrevibacter sp. TaxID=66852 RepID=UPI00388F3E2E